jgi:glycosyltransferase involved in cell wall biosynthesis
MKITAIICVYNEENTVKNVVTQVSNYPFDEVIIVNDGSTDKTDSILKKIKEHYNFKYIILPKNKGKGFAMARGIEIAKSEILVFFDADLSNIQKNHFTELITPILNNDADMVLGQPTETMIDSSINPFKSFTGQRALKKSDIYPIIPKLKNSRFGVETLINLYYQSECKTIKHVILKGLKHPTKYQHLKLSKSLFLRDRK